MTGIAFIGSGGVAELHARALRETSGQLRGVWSRSAENAAAFAARHRTQAYASLQALLDDPQVDAVFVLTALSSHADLALRALDAGKHVLLEKPVGATLDEVRRLQAAAQRSGRLCMPSHNYIHAPEMQRLNAHAKAGRLGRLHSFWVLYNQGQPVDQGSPDSMLLELMLHHLYTMLYFVGRPQRLWATGSDARFGNTAKHDQIMISGQFADGLIANLWGSFAADDRSREPWTVQFKLIGSEGSGGVAWDQVKTGTEPQPGWDDAAYWDSFLYTQRHFLDECLAQGRAPLSTLADALDVACLTEAARESIRSGASVEVRYPD